MNAAIVNKDGIVENIIYVAPGKEIPFDNTYFTGDYIVTVGCHYDNGIFKTADGIECSFVENSQSDLQNRLKKMEALLMKLSEGSNT